MKELNWEELLNSSKCQEVLSLKPTLPWLTLFQCENDSLSLPSLEHIGTCPGGVCFCAMGCVRECVECASFHKVREARHQASLKYTQITPCAYYTVSTALLLVVGGSGSNPSLAVMCSLLLWDAWTVGSKCLQRAGERVH